MERIILKEAEIIDPINKKFFSTTFKDGINVISSEETSRGKSSLARVLYHTLGANAPYDKKFKAPEKIFSVILVYGEIEYKIIRYKLTYICYKNGIIVEKISSDYKKLSRFFENEFGISVYLTDRNNDFDIAPTSFCFIPYVLDQDKSWKSNDLPFNNMGQFLDANRIDLYYFHLNILNVEYYKINKDKIITEKRITDRETSIKSMLEEIKTLKEYYSVDNIALSEDDAKVNLENMRMELTRAIEKNVSIQTRLMVLDEELIKLNSQKNETQNLLESLVREQKDMLTKSIKCPNCEVEINLSDYDDLKSSYSVEYLKESLKSIDYDIQAKREERDVLKKEYLESVAISNGIRDRYDADNELFKKYVKLNALAKMLEDREVDVARVIDEINDLENSLIELKKKLDKYSINKLEVGSEFKDIYLSNLTGLGVKNITKRDITTFKKIILSGNQDPRSTLAFLFAFLQLKRKLNPTGFLLPIVIDSPFEGDPDKYNKVDIIRDIVNNCGENEQIIIGLRNAKEYFKDVAMPYNIIELDTEKDSLLSSVKFKENLTKMNAIMSLFGL